ncbi:hypothetical protein HN51_065505 [Arachis hypogaea]|uniref:UspA domain-containing protein n=3 Tax=Arachis TaxID=3817 RepID=A0A444WPD0_ARAHY|nr:universal stress protein PHOS32 [Arachis duranensis]XP_020975806.1 universal stress protein PHOS32 [Arachis ipaensis]XP_025644836.1 universal stress protein PHOS32 [Arachis hypogaea]XP_025692106.1 universal stress protein PHOS32 [Arachis hypogaea]QHO06655.1 Universal stress protein A-like protein [Arachis hypogaea]QHO37750.1 Universal stress protein A-like protein [Arachis hypogaea]RYQ79379.1 hypothetical protein Ahy_Scaffold6g108119 [Arachis hypogaea]RYR12758.1 hypothetical protein Ahy_B
MPRSNHRRLGVAMDFSPCSVAALKWAVENFAREGDHIILLIIRPDVNYEHGEMQLWELTGAPYIPLNEFTDAEVMKKYGLKPTPEAIEVSQKAAKDKKVEVLMKIFWGDPREKICQAVDSIPLEALFMGNRGLGPLQRAFMGSVSNYVVNHATCPVTVVKSDNQNKS